MLVCEMAAFYKKHGKSLAQVIDSLYEEHGYYLNHTSAFEFDGAAGMEKMNNIMAEITIAAAAVIVCAGLQNLRGKPEPGFAGAGRTDHTALISRLR